MAGIVTPARAARSLVLLLLFCGGSVRAAESVEALRYGVSLYHLYQGDYFDSLTELMVGQKLEQLGPHMENAELLRGGVSLSYGMDREAERIFQALLSEPREGVDRNRAWFYLAKLAWQRGELQRAAAALDQVDALASARLAEEATYLRSAIALRQGDRSKSSAVAQVLPEASDWRLYHAYNMGASLAADEQWSEASIQFHQFDDTELYSDELKALRDRAYTAAGYAAIAAGDYRAAAGDFRQVRLDGAMSDRALLGYGWASVETDDYLAALGPWQVLSEKPPLNQSVRESLLAVPYAYEKLGKNGLALRNYQGAAQVLQQELDSVRAAIREFEAGELELLLQLEVDGSDEWLFGEDILPVSEDAPYLSHLIASHSFQSAMKELRDLQRIDHHLLRARHRLQVLREADSEQQANWRALIDEGGRDQLQQRRTALLQELEQLRQRLAQAEIAADGRALADTARLAQWQRLERAVATAQALQANSQQPAEQDSGQEQLLHIYRGLLIWDDNEQYAERRWQATRALAELEQLAAATEAGIARLDQRISERRVSNFAPRIDVTEQRVEQQRTEVSLALGASEQGLRKVAVAELQAQAQQLARSLGQSRLAIARLYDRGSVGASP